MVGALVIINVNVWDIRRSIYSIHPVCILKVCTLKVKLKLFCLAFFYLANKANLGLCATYAVKMMC